MFERSNYILYEESGSRLDEDIPNRYRYMGQDTDQKTYEKKFKELGITEDMEIKGMCYGNALELLNP